METSTWMETLESHACSFRLHNFLPSKSACPTSTQNFQVSFLSRISGCYLGSPSLSWEQRQVPGWPFATQEERLENQHPCGLESQEGAGDVGLTQPYPLGGIWTWLAFPEDLECSDLFVTGWWHMARVVAFSWWHSLKQDPTASCPLPAHMENEGLVSGDGVPAKVWSTHQGSSIRNCLPAI